VGGGGGRAAQGGGVLRGLGLTYPLSGAEGGVGVHIRAGVIYDHTRGSNI